MKVYCPVVTPFNRDLSINPEMLVEHCRWLVSRNVGLAPFGTTSEGNSLSVEEKIDVLDALIAADIAPRLMIPGTGASALPDTVRLTTHATQIGCAGVLMLPPFYYKGVTDEGLFRSYSEVIQRVGDSRLRIYLYHIPPVSQVAITIPLIDRLLTSYPEIIAGIKDSSGDWENTRGYLDNFAAAGFAVFPGSERFLLQGMRHGAQGCISATANINPRAISQLAQGWEAPDAEAQQAALNEVRGIFERVPVIAAVKATIARHRKTADWATVRPPLVELSTAQSTALFTELDTRGFAL
jgi:4-hydroxy-tetrahydrodipicolinate synthase